MESIWTPELCDSLRNLWAQDLPTAEIARRLGVGKNAAIGKAHRMKLTPRTSPLYGGLTDKQKKANGKKISASLRQFHENKR